MECSGKSKTVDSISLYCISVVDAVLFLCRFVEFVSLGESFVGIIIATLFRNNFLVWLKNTFLYIIGSLKFFFCKT